LPDRYREVVALRYFATLSESETAAVLSCPLGTAKSRLSRALDLLRVTLDEEVTR
jgi:RNA polymerase sigma-70 factor (ECF subfamily)